MLGDKHVTENSGLLRKLLPGEIFSADRGFDIADSVAYYQAKLHIPAFTKGKVNFLPMKWMKKEK